MKKIAALAIVAGLSLAACAKHNHNAANANADLAANGNFASDGLRVNDADPAPAGNLATPSLDNGGVGNTQ